MLEALLMSQNAERVLMFILVREEGYAREIARFYEVDADSIQKQLAKFEQSGILVCRPVGRSKVYLYNPRYPFLPELKALLQKALSFYPESAREALIYSRSRPRRSGKPL